MPTVQPARHCFIADPGVGRLYGKTCAGDRRRRDLCLGPTHEKSSPNHISAVKCVLPPTSMNLYQNQTSSRGPRDPPRPRPDARARIPDEGRPHQPDPSGDDASADISYKKEDVEAYRQIFSRMVALQFHPVARSRLQLHRQLSHEFMVLARNGEEHPSPTVPDATGSPATSRRAAVSLIRPGRESHPPPSRK